MASCSFDGATNTTYSSTPFSQASLIEMSEGYLRLGGK